MKMLARDYVSLQSRDDLMHMNNKMPLEEAAVEAAIISADKLRSKQKIAIKGIVQGSNAFVSQLVSATI